MASTYSLSDTRLFFDDNPPLDLESALTRRQSLLAEVAAIQYDLGTHKTSSKGSKNWRASNKPFEANRGDWIQKAKAGLYWRQSEALFLKRWSQKKRDEGALTALEIRQRRQSLEMAAAGLGFSPEELDTSDPIALLNALYFILAHLMEMNVEFNNAERYVVFAAHKFLKGKKIPSVAPLPVTK